MGDRTGTIYYTNWQHEQPIQNLDGGASWEISGNCNESKVLIYNYETIKTKGVLLNKKNML